MLPALLTLALLMSVGCAKDPNADPGPGVVTLSESPRSRPSPPAEPIEAGQAEAIFAGGCFWCMEKPFDVVPGVLSTTSGYIDGHVENPAYYDVANGTTGHTEALRVIYDPEAVSYSRLLQVFWHNIDPTQADGQFCDKGTQYRSGVYTNDPAERALAESGKVEVAAELGAEVVTEIKPAGTFWVAEDYHQDFYLKDPTHYGMYRLGCGRDARLKRLWGQHRP